jgi:hypothetical protein
VVLPAAAVASELDLQLPTLDPTQRQLLMLGLGVCVVGMLFGLVMFNQVKAMPAHKSMLDVSAIIYETCKAYLLKQGQLLIVLEIFIGACIVYYFGFLQHMDAMRVVTILAFSVLGILGSYGVAWFGIRMNTFANSRTAVRLAQGQAAARLRDPAAGGHEHRRAADLRRAAHDARHPAVGARRPGRCLLPRLRHRRVARRLGAAHRGRHLHQDRRHRLRPHEGRVQDQGRRSAQSRASSRTAPATTPATRSDPPPTASRPTA